MKILISSNNVFMIIFFVAIFGLITSCHFNDQYLDREEDKNDAEKITSEFYKNLQNHDSIALFKLFSDKFWGNTDSIKFYKDISNIEGKLGKLEKIELDHWNTRVVEGTDPISEYVLYYLNKYEKHEAKETINLLKENGQIKIVGYNINSDGFLQE